MLNSTLSLSPRRSTPPPQRAGGGNLATHNTSANQPTAGQRPNGVQATAKHEEDRTELIQLIRRQGERIEKLKVDSAVQLEHRATLRRLEHEGLRETTIREIATITPQLDLIRAQWSQAREASSGYEVQWGSMRSQLQQMRGRVDALREQVDGSEQQNELARQQIKDMREQLHRLNRDKANIRHKVKSALEALVTDDEVLKSRLHEEEQYRNQLVQALAAMRSEYADAQQDSEQEFAPLREDLRALQAYLDEMQGRTKSLERYCVDLETKLFTVERKWIDDVHNVFGSLERANQRVQLKSVVLSALEHQIAEKRNANVKPRTSNGHADTLWLSNSLAVWETVIKKEISQQKQKMGMREDGAQLLAQTTQIAQRTRVDLEELKKHVEGESYERRLLLHEIADTHFLLQEKKINEEQMIHYVQDVCTQLDENLSNVLSYIRRDGFDDYVSSTDEDEEEVQGFAPLAEENTDDVIAIMSSLDFDPDDPQFHERLREMSHRPTGPLLDFAQRKATFLREVGSGRGADGVNRSRRGAAQETFDRAVMSVQLRLADEVVSFVKNRQSQIQQGLLDPRNERLNADPKYVEHARQFHTRTEDFVQQQKDAPMRGTGLSYRRDRIGGGGTPVGTPGRAGGGPMRRIAIDSARVPPEVARGNPLTKASFYLSNAVHGMHSLVVPRSKMVPELRHIFLSRDLSKIIARRVDALSTNSLDTNTDDTTSVRIADVADILLGHKTDVFREARIASKHMIREERAFSIITTIGATLDIECDSLEDRNYWASTFAWIINESRPGGVVQILVKAGKLSVVDSLNHTKESVEVSDRQTLQVRIAA
ncbi:Hypothetical protein, putative [Bodo saltans]|uniref:PH domain-containing protein n=1 Tax=Bodo saltans TaxID=75058 RepID=A0A0S4JGD3_BODSA|nr:Hypothetical protein, putative [Bodo saltans]|eukprot:CUG90528.1 Hypothetical protein, putative [Bodo saltans]